MAIVAAYCNRINDLDVADVLKGLLGEARRHAGKSTMGVTSNNNNAVVDFLLWLESFLKFIRFFFLLVKEALYGFFGTVAHRAPMFAAEHVDSMISLFKSEIQKEVPNTRNKIAPGAIY